jgi:hypothetical protein
VNPARRAAADARGVAFGQAIAEHEAAVGGTDGAFRLHRSARDEAARARVVLRLAARLRVQMNDRAPSARHRDEIALRAS